MSKVRLSQGAFGRCGALAETVPPCPGLRDLGTSHMWLLRALRSGPAVSPAWSGPCPSLPPSSLLTHHIQVGPSQQAFPLSVIFRSPTISTKPLGQTAEPRGSRLDLALHLGSSSVSAIQASSLCWQRLPASAALDTGCSFMCFVFPAGPSSSLRHLRYLLSDFTSIHGGNGEKLLHSEEELKPPESSRDSH